MGISAMLERRWRLQDIPVIIPVGDKSPQTGKGEATMRCGRYLVSFSLCQYSSSAP
jgi:hypothetical protein